MRGKTTANHSWGTKTAGASMRPPLNAGEDAIASAKISQEAWASMRPPLNAGEDSLSDVMRSRRLQLQ